MEQLAEKVRSIEQRKYEKERNKKIDKNRDVRSYGNVTTILHVS